MKKILLFVFSVVLSVSLFSQTYSVTFNVDMTDSINAGWFVEGTDELFLGTNINSWAVPGSDGAMELTESTTDNIYTITLSLAPGSYQYKYFKIVGGVASWDNGEWPGDPNRTFEVVNADVVLNNVFGSLTTSFKEINANISVSPNPASDFITITADQNFNVEILDITGRVIKSTVMNNNVSNINIADQQSGIYIVRLSNENGTVTQKIIKK